MTYEKRDRRMRASKAFKAIIIVAIYLGFSIVLASFQPDTILDMVGANNAFVLMFVLGIVGGFTTFTGIPYHLVLMSLAAGGLSPIGLGLCTAIGVMIGDSTMYLIGKSVKDSLSPRIHATIDQFSRYLGRHPKLVAPALVTYGAVSPFSNDFIVASFSMMNRGYWQTIIPLTIGNIFYNTALAYLGFYAYDTIIAWF